MMSDLPPSVHIMEVGPRDGLQIEARTLTTEQKLELLDAILASGIREIEAGSFVNPRAVPQMADTAAAFAGLTRKPGVVYRALWLNPRGLQRASATPNVDLEGRLQLTASDTFAKRNTNRSIEETFEETPDEGLAFLCEEMGIATNLDLEAPVAAAKLAEAMVGHPVPGKIMKGGTLDALRRH